MVSLENINDIETCTHARLEHIATTREGPAMRDEHNKFRGINRKTGFYICKCGAILKHTVHRAGTLPGDSYFKKHQNMDNFTPYRGGLTHDEIVLYGNTCAGDITPYDEIRIARISGR